MLKNILNKLISLAGHKFAKYILAAWCFIENIFFPIPYATIAPRKAKNVAIKKVSSHFFGLEIDIGITIASDGKGKKIFSIKHQAARKYLANLCPAKLISLFNIFFNINLSCIFEF